MLTIKDCLVWIALLQLQQANLKSFHPCKNRVTSFLVYTWPSYNTICLPPGYKSSYFTHTQFVMFFLILPQSVQIKPASTVEYVKLLSMEHFTVSVRVACWAAAVRIVSTHFYSLTAHWYMHKCKQIMIWHGYIQSWQSGTACMKCTGSFFGTGNMDFSVSSRRSTSVVINLTMICH